jgi:hypothetical protein
LGGNQWALGSEFRREIVLTARTKKRGIARVDSRSKCIVPDLDSGKPWGPNRAELVRHVERLEMRSADSEAPPGILASEESVVEVCRPNEIRMPK